MSATTETSPSRASGRRRFDGWRWAGRNPDRRNKEAVRMAHPLRRSTDTALTPTMKRAAALGATGVTLYAISKVMRRWLNNGR